MMMGTWIHDFYGYMTVNLDTVRDFWAGSVLVPRGRLLFMSIIHCDVNTIYPYHRKET